MIDHRIEIVTGGEIEPPILSGVSAGDPVTIANLSGTGVAITYPEGGNPFKEVEEGTTEDLADGAATTHTIAPDFDPARTYDLEVELEISDFLSSPRIRITGGETR
jgi:hypothetical protein